MDVVSIVFFITIAISVLFCAFRGLIKSIITYISGILSLVLSAVFCRPFSRLFHAFSFVGDCENNIYNWLICKDEVFSQTIYKDSGDLTNKALESLNVPSLVRPVLSSKILENIPNEGAVIGTFVAQLLVSFMLVIISFFLLFLLFRLLFFILKKLLCSITESSQVLRSTDRIFGALFGLFIGIIYVDVMCFAISGIIALPFLENVSDWLIKTMELNSNEFTLSKFFYNHNLISYVLSLFF